MVARCSLIPVFPGCLPGLCSLELKSISDFSILGYIFFFFPLLNHRLSPDGDGMPSEEWASFQAPSSGDGPQNAQSHSC